MARALRKDRPMTKPDTFPSCPALRGNAASVYERCYPDCFKLFGNRIETPTTVADETVLPVFAHELRHDAESSFWVFFWWIVLAAPQGERQRVCVHQSHCLESDFFGWFARKSSLYVIYYAWLRRRKVPAWFYTSSISSTLVIDHLHGSFDSKGLLLGQRRKV